MIRINLNLVLFLNPYIFFFFLISTTKLNLCLQKLEIENVTSFLVNPFVLYLLLIFPDMCAEISEKYKYSLRMIPRIIQYRVNIFERTWNLRHVSAAIVTNEKFA